MPFKPNAADEGKAIDNTSSKDLSYFRLKRETLKLLMTYLKLPEHFLTIIRTKDPESAFFFVGNSQRMSEFWLLYLFHMAAIS